MATPQFRDELSWIIWARPPRGIRTAAAVKPIQAAAERISCFRCCICMPRVLVSMLS
jgi:hypothetical protein